MCFQCGNPVADPPRIHYLASGEPCSHCRDRFVDSLPTLLPGEEPMVEEEPAESEAESYGFPDDAYFGGGGHPA